MAIGEIGPLGVNQILGRPTSGAVASVVILASSAQQVAVPANAHIAAFSFNADIWVTYGASTGGAVAPSSNSTAGSTATAEFNPTVRYIGSSGATTAINIGSEYTCKGSVTFYS